MLPQGIAGRLFNVLAPVVFVSMIDRGLLAFAAADLSRALEMDTAEYGAVAGAFYLPYAVLQFPSLWVANRTNPRSWLGAVLVLVGLITFATAFVRSKAQLAMARILLGAVEGGIFPIMFLVVNNTLREPAVTHVWTWMYATIQLSLIAAGPFADAINTTLHGVAGLAGWQWMFVLNGLLAMACAGYVVAALPVGPDEPIAEVPMKARRVSDEGSVRLRSPQRRPSLSPVLERSSGGETTNLLQSLRDWKTAYLSATQVFAAVPGAAFAYFSPMLIEDLLRGANNHTLADAKRTAFLLNAVPFTLAFLGISLVSQTMKVTRDRFWHGTIALLVSGTLSLLYPTVYMTGSTASTFTCICVYYAVYATFSVALDTLPVLYCSMGGQSPAAVYCMANSFKALGELVGPPSCGYFMQRFGSAVAVSLGGLGFILPTGILFVLFFYIASSPATPPVMCKYTEHKCAT